MLLTSTPIRARAVRSTGRRSRWRVQLRYRARTALAGAAFAAAYDPVEVWLFLLLAVWIALVTPLGTPLMFLEFSDDGIPSAGL